MNETGPERKVYPSTQADIAQLHYALERSEERVRVLEYDKLTDLWNNTVIREKLEQYIEEAKETGRTFAFLIADLDKTKEVNDTISHIKGDEYIRAFADSVRDNDFVVGRSGGDEFYFMLFLEDARNKHSDSSELREVYLSPEDQVEAASLSVEKRALAKIQEIGLGDIGGVSVGGAVFDVNETLESLVNRADKRMYQRKFEKKERKEAKDRHPSHTSIPIKPN